MSTVVPLAVGTLGVILIVVLILGVFVLAALAYGLSRRGNPRQVKVDAERERVAEQSLLSEPVDFESDLRPPRDS
jgi:hypothetical protein